MPDVDLGEFQVRFALELLIPEQPDPEMPLTELEQYDSMGRIQTGILIEELFGIEISYDEFAQLRTLREIFDFCVSKSRG